MTKENTQSKPRRRFGDEDIASVQTALEKGQLNYEPRNRLKTMRGLLDELREDIIALRQRGYTLVVIADMLRDGGFDHLTPSTLRKYVSAVSARKRRRKRSVRTTNVTRPSASTPPPQTPLRPAQSSAAPTRRGEFTVTPDREDL